MKIGYLKSNKYPVMSEGLSVDYRFQRFSGEQTVDGRAVAEGREQRKLNSYCTSGKLEADRTEKEIFCKAELGALDNS